MSSKLPSSIENAKLISLYEAALKELVNITLETAFPYVVNDNINSPAPEIVPVVASDMDVADIEYQIAADNEPTTKYEKRRDLIKNSFELHRYKGTVRILEEIFGKVGRSDGQIEEWFEYNGNPFEYKIHINTPLNKENGKKVFGLIERYKRLTAKQITSYENDIFNWYAASGLRCDRIINFPVQTLTSPAIYFTDANGDKFIDALGNYFVEV